MDFVECWVNFTWNLRTPGIGKGGKIQTNKQTNNSFGGSRVPALGFFGRRFFRKSCAQQDPLGWPTWSICSFLGQAKCLGLVASSLERGGGYGGLDLKHGGLVVFSKNLPTPNPVWPRYDIDFLGGGETSPYFLEVSPRNLGSSFSKDLPPPTP